jgi:Cu+-exporting ATPase
MKIDNKKLKLQVEGMTCANCAAGIKKHLENNGLQDVNVNFSTGEASWGNDKQQDKNDVAKTITNLGYKIKSS